MACRRELTGEEIAPISGLEETANEEAQTDQLNASKGIQVQRAWHSCGGGCRGGRSGGDEGIAQPADQLKAELAKSGMARVGAEEGETQSTGLRREKTRILPPCREWRDKTGSREKTPTPEWTSAVFAGASAPRGCPAPLNRGECHHLQQWQ